MTTQQFQEIKDLAYQKIQDRLNIDTGMKEEIVKKFGEWFQMNYLQAKMAKLQQKQEVGDQQEGAPQ